MRARHRPSIERLRLLACRILCVIAQQIVFQRRSGSLPVGWWQRADELPWLWSSRLAGRDVVGQNGLGAEGGGLGKIRTLREILFLGRPSLTDGERALFVTGQMQRLGREGEVDTFRVEAFHDLEVNPAGMRQIVPILGGVEPVDDQDVQRGGIEVVKEHARVTFSGGVS